MSYKNQIYFVYENPTSFRDRIISDLGFSFILSSLVFVGFAYESIFYSLIASIFVSIVSYLRSIHINKFLIVKFIVDQNITQILYYEGNKLKNIEGKTSDFVLRERVTGLELFGNSYTSVEYNGKEIIRQYLIGRWELNFMFNFNEIKKSITHLPPSL